jgi:Flp pilus assembly protein CpaB
LNRRLRIGIIVAVVGIVLVLAGLLVMNLLIKQAFQPVTPPTATPEAKVTIYVANGDLDIGTLISADNLRPLEIPLGIAPRNAVTDPALVLDRILKAPLVDGQMILLSNLADPTNIQHDIAFELDRNKVLLAFPASDLMSSLSILQRGDVIDIFVSMNVSVEIRDTNTILNNEPPRVESRLFTFDALQKVQITALVVEVTQQGEQAQTVSVAASTPAPTAVPPPSAIKIKSLLLALDPQDAILLKHLKDAGATFDYVLRSPTSDQFFEVQPVMPEYLRDRYQLEIIQER